MESTGLAPVAADTNAPANATEVDSEVAPAGGAESAPAADGDSGKPPRDRVQERIDSLTREKYEAFSERDRERYQREALQQRLEALEAAKPQPVAPVKPTLESCGWDEGEFERQLLAYNGSRTAASTANVSEAVKAQLAAEREAERREQSAKGWERKEAEFIKSKPDYVEKVHGGLAAKTWACTKEMAEAIAEVGGPEIGYYLAENGEKSREIARLPPHLQAAEIGRIAGKLEAAKTAPPPVSKAPPPAPKLDGANATDDSIPNPSWSDERFEKWRQRQIAQR